MPSPTTEQAVIDLPKEAGDGVNQPESLDQSGSSSIENQNNPATAAVEDPPESLNENLSDEMDKDDTRNWLISNLSGYESGKMLYHCNANNCFIYINN